MNKIIFPLELNMRGAGVADLQEGLRLCLDNGVFQLNDAERQAFQDRLHVESTQNIFGQATGELVGLFQKQRQLEASGVVDEATAKALNAILEQLGAFGPAAPDQQRLVGGQVRSADNQPLPGAIVRAFDVVDDRGVLRLGEDTTDAEGRYTIRYAMLPGVDAIDLRVVVFDANGKLLCASDVIGEAKPLEIVDLTMPLVEQPAARVSGIVRQANGTPLVGALVRAFDKDLRTEEPLGEPATTDPAGRYEITYKAEQFSRAEKGSADLIVRVSNGAEMLSVSSPIIFNAQPIETVDLRMNGRSLGPSEYDELNRELKLVLQDVQLAELTAEDMTFLAGDTGFDPQRITWLAESARHAQDTALEDSSIRTHIQLRYLPVEVFYGWFRQNLPTEIEALLNQDENTLRQALEASVGSNIISTQVLEQTDLIFVHWNEFKLQRGLKPAPEGSRASLGDLLRTMPQPLGRDQQGVVAAVVGEVRVDDEQFAKQLQAAGLDPQQAVGVQRTLRLGNLTLQHAPLVRGLQEIVGLDADASLRSLAALTSDRWLDLTYMHGTPASEGLSKAEYAAQLERQVEAIHPTATLATKLSTGRLAIAQPGFGELSTFLQNNPSLDVLGTPIETAAAEARFDGIEHKDEVLSALQQLQRVKALSATWQESAVLLNIGVESALHVVELGRDRLGDIMEGRIPSDRLDTIYEVATLTHDTTLTVMVATLPQFSSLTPRIGLLADTTPAVDQVAPISPTLRGLFGDLDVCECQHCGSVLSPAAYFVDLLEFIKPNTAALAALLGHRSDLLDLELSCENTETELPHIDLVLEILENAVGLPREVVLPIGTDADALLTTAAAETVRAGTAPLPQVLTAALGETALDVPNQFAVVAGSWLLMLNGPSLWTISDRHRRWGLLHHESGLFASRGGLPAVHKLPLAVADIAAMIAALDTGSVLASARPEFETFLMSLHPNDPLLRIHSFQIDQLQPGSRWKVTYVLGLRVEIKWQVTNPIGSMTITSLAGDLLFSDTYSTPAIQATAEALGAGKVGGILPAWLGSGPPLQVAQDTINDRWIIQSKPYELELNFQTENLTIAALAYQSSGPDKDLLAAPENRNPAAYRVLRAAEFPWSLPFDLPLTEVRGFLEKLRLPRRQLMELLTPPAARLANDGIAREVLGLSATAAVLISTPDTSVALWRRWGLDVQNGSVTIHDAATDTPVTGMPLVLLAHVSILLQQARLTFSELQDVLQTQFVRGSTTQQLTIEPLSECAPSKMTLHDLTEEHLDRIHRFVRLWRAIGWPAHELDLALAAVSPDAQNGTEVLRRLSHIKRLHETLGLSVEVIAAWWSGLGAPVSIAHTQPGQPEIWPLYDRLFLNPLMSKPLDPAFRLNDARTELSSLGVSISAKTTLICAALGTRQDDLQALIAAAAPVTPEVPDSLTLANLSSLHRILSLSRALGLSTADYLRARRLTGINPFAGTDLALAFCEAIAAIRKARFSVEELAYVLRHEASAGYAAALSDDRAAAILVELRAELQAVRQAVLDARAPFVERLQTYLTRAGWTPAIIDALLRDIGGQATIKLPDVPELLSQLRLPKTLRSLIRVSDHTLETLDMLPLTAFVRADLESLYQAVPTTTTGYADYVLAVDQLKDVLEQRVAAAVATLQQLKIGLPGESIAPQFMFTATEATQLLVPQNGADARYLAILERLLEREQRKRTIVSIARIFAIDEATAAGLLLERLHHPGDVGRPAVTALLDVGFLNSDARTAPDHTMFASAFTLVHRLHKVALLCQRLEMTPAVLSWLSAFTALNLDDVPVGPLATGAANLFDDWQRLLTITRLPHRVPGAGPMIAAYVAALTPGDVAAFAAARAALAAGLELTPATVEEAARLLSRIQLGLITPADGRDPSYLEQLLKILLAVRQTGASPEQLAMLAAPAPDAPSSEAAALLARQLLRGKYGADQWHDLLRPISDALRERQRDALIDYLLVRDGKLDANDLYESYLIDVQMAPCMVTTRVLQATSAVQLFVQRCLLNLEQYVPPKDIDRARWEWMKNYRVWEANRKVFLYPENWLLPELRDDKTQAFQELEGALGQDEPSDERATDALVGYLDDLGELAQITVVGMYEDARTVGTQEKRVLYAVGRSPNQPYRYFWRVCERFGQDGMQWSGWQRIELDIPGDHVLPFIFEGDLHIAWPIILRKEQDGKTSFEVQLAWARRAPRGWTKRKLSRDPFRVVGIPNRDERSMFAFRVERMSGNPEAVIIQCYVTERDRSLDLRPEPPQTIKGAANVPPTVTLTFLSYVEYSNPTAYEATTTVSFEGLGFYESSTPAGLTLTPMTSGEWYHLNDISLHTGGTYKLTGWPTGDITLRFRATTRFPDGQTAQKEEEIVLIAGFSHTCIRSFTFSSQNAPGRLTDAGIQLPMQLEGRFMLTSGGDVEFRAIDGATKLATIEKSYSWMSGYREVGPDGGDSHGVSIDKPIFGASHSNERFFLLPSSPWANNAPFEKTRLWYFAEDQRRYYLDLRTNPNRHSLTVYPDSYTESGRYRRLAAHSLPTLFEPGEKGPQVTTFGADEELTTYLAGSRYELLDDPRPPKNSLPDIGFVLRMPYAIYHWELFVHAPLRIADELARQQRFEDALRWLHFVFDPTTNEPADPKNPTGRYWKALPLRRSARPTRVADVLAWLANTNKDHPEEAELRNQIDVWQRNPFRPHAIARLRHGAYQWRVLFSYLDTLIAWADQLFQRDTRESIGEATQLYVLAARILGPRPRVTPRRLQAPALSYRALAQRNIDKFANVWYEFANTPRVKAAVDDAQNTKSGKRTRGNDDMTNGDKKGRDILSGHSSTQSLKSLGMLYFCVPQNEKLSTYWDTIEYRLFKIRHCQNIEGVWRELAPWEPPIDPEILVRATAAGVDIAAVLSDRAAPLPAYRFNVLAQKASELCAELRSLGAALLAALEKQDAEELALLRSGHEVELLKLVSQIRQQQIDEADANLEALRRTRRLAAERYIQYQRLLGNPQQAAPAEGTDVPQETLSLRPAPGAGGEMAGLGMTQREVDQLFRLNEAQGFSIAAGLSNTLAGAAFTLAVVYPATKVWAEPAGHALNAAGGSLNSLSTYASQWATKDAIIAGYERRRDEWAFQSNLAALEMAQIDKQIAAAVLRVAIAQQELANHERQIGQSEGVDDFLRAKYTNAQLYGWMVGQVAGIYFQTYQLAHDVAKRVERAFRYELGIDASNYIRFGYWDGLKRGLMAGEHLFHDLKRLEVAYLEQNRREYEITKHISLLQLDPQALITLKETGACQFELPEWAFDLDFPGHYFRRIKTLGLSIPCVIGPYTSVNATLTLLRSRGRRSTTTSTSYPWTRDFDDGRFDYDMGGAQSIATSSGQNDSGMFEFSFRDERYLPFEGAGAISTWRLELAEAFRPFDYSTISDVVLHLRYTARPGGEMLKTAATDALQVLINDAAEPPLARVFSLRHEFPGEWHHFLNPVSATGDQTLELDLRGRFPLMFQSTTSTITIAGVEVYVKAAAGTDFKLALKVKAATGGADVTLAFDTTPPTGSTAAPLTHWEGMLKGTKSAISAAPGAWTLTAWSGSTPATHARIDPSMIEEILLVCQYTVTVTP